MLKKYFLRPKLVALIESSIAEVVTEKCCSTVRKKPVSNYYGEILINGEMFG